MKNHIKAAEAALKKARERLEAAEKAAGDLTALKDAVKKAEDDLAEAKAEVAAAPPPAARHPLMWVALAVVIAGAFIALAIALRPLPVAPPAPVAAPAPATVASPPAAVTLPPPVTPPAAVTPPTATRPVVRPPVAVVTPPPVAVTPPPPPPPAAAPEMGFAVDIFSIREDVHASEHWVLVGFRFAGDTRSVREWTLLVGSEQLPWGPFVPGRTYEVRLPRPAGATTLQPLARLASGEEVAGEPVNWTPSR